MRWRLVSPRSTSHTNVGHGSDASSGGVHQWNKQGRREAPDDGAGTRTPRHPDGGVVAQPDPQRQRTDDGVRDRDGLAARTVPLEIERSGGDPEVASAPITRSNSRVAPWANSTSTRSPSS